MDIGKFKSSRGRLILWILVPPLLIAGVGLSTYALQLQSEWKLTRAKRLSEVLPQLVESRERATVLLEEFQGTETANLRSEDELISFIQEIAAKVGFTVDSLKVNRLPGKDGKLPSFSASVTGSGEIDAIQRFLAGVSSEQQLLSESELQISQMANEFNESLCRADITFELVIFNALDGEGR